MNRRIPVLVIIVGLILSGLLIDRTLGSDGADTDDAPVMDLGSFAVAADASARSSTWFCAGGTANDDAFANHVVTLVNAQEAPVTVTMTVFGGVVAPPVPGSEAPADGDATTTTTTEAPAADIGEPVTKEIEVQGRSRYRVPLTDFITAPIASALVEASAGGIVVEHEVISVNGRDAKPCVTKASTEWHFAWGNTTVVARELLVLFNPFPADAIIDGAFSTEDGAREPVRFDGLVVPGRSTVAVDLGDDVTRREEVAASIRARSGQIVVDRILRINSDSFRGLTVQSGVTEPQLAWAFPDGVLRETVREKFVVYNPTDQLAEATLTVSLDEPETNGVPESIDVSLPPRSHQTIDLTEEMGIPLDVGHVSIVRSANGVPIVAEQVQLSEGATRRGISVTTGSPVDAEAWTFAAGAANSSNDYFLSITNLDPQVLAKVDVSVISEGQLIPVADLQGVEIGPEQRLSFRLGEKIQRDELALVVTSTEPVVVQRGWYQIGDERGINATVGVPSLAGLRLLVDPLDADLTLDLEELENAPTTDPNAPPVAPDDVELPGPDETIVVDPDAEADLPDSTTTTAAP